MGINLHNPTPLYQQIADDIKHKIAAGEMKVGDQLGSHQELARKYNVSLITVKKALADLISSRVLYSRVGKGTFVARKSAAIDFSKLKTIGLVLSDLKNPFFSLITYSVEAKASELGYNILISNSSHRIDKEESQIRHFLDIGVDGLIIASLTHVYRATDTICSLRDRNFPYIMVSYIEDNDINFVGTDHELGGFLATEHLINGGYQKIGYINGEEGNLIGDLREKGYRQALQQYGLDVKQNYIYRLPQKRIDYQSGYDIGKQFFATEDIPAAMFVYNDLAAIGFEDAVLEQGKRIPQDVAIVGFDNIERARYAAVPLTTVHQSTSLIGELAVESLVAMIGGQTIETRQILEPKLIIRESCGVRKKSE